VARMTDVRNAHKILVGKCEAEIHLGDLGLGEGCY
jgi:hypothetical protein